MRLIYPVTLALLVAVGGAPLLPPAIAQSTSPLSAQDPLAWTNPYATSLEDQTDLVVTAQPLTATLTRIELAQWLTEVFRYLPDRTQTIAISDMVPDTPDYWTAQAVIQSGIMRLYEGDEFRANGDITKLEALAILVRALQLPPPTQEDVTAWISLYNDAGDIPEIGYPFVAMSGQAGLLVNHPDPALLQPNVVLRRGEGIVLLHQTYVARQAIQPIDPPIAQLAPATPVAAAPTTPNPLSPAPAGTTTPVPPSSADADSPVIFARRIQPESGVVAPGETLTIEIQATSGGTATVDIGSRIRGIPMQEVSPGLYRAVYQPTANDTVLSPDISIQLTVAGRPTRLLQKQPQLVLGQAAPAPVTPTLDTGSPPVSSNPAPPTPAFPPPNPAAQSPQGSQAQGSQTQGSQAQGSQQALNPTRPANAQYPEFTGIRIRPLRNLQEGDILTINVWGESGALAEFELGDLAKNQPMREIQPNMYEGTYVVAPDDRATAPTLKILFTKNGLTRQHTELFLFSIDGSVGTRSTIQPPATTPVSATPPRIESVTTNAAGRVLQAEDILIVTMRGNRGARATFRIVNITPEIQMQEVSPGLYEGKVQIPSNMNPVTNGVLEGILLLNGQQAVQASNSPVSIQP